MEMRIPTAFMLAVIFLSPLHPANASDWYKAAFCMEGNSACSIYQCPLSDVSPAQIYENNEVYGGAKIIDSGGDEVDVIAQGTRYVFFRTADGCQKFVAAQLKTDQQQRQEQQKALEPYR